MSEKRFICGLGFPINSDDPIRIISDSVENKDYYKFSDICNVLNEQQATIEQLQDLCGKSDGENMKLRIENKMLEKEVNLLRPTNIEQYEQIQKLQEENEKLRKELGDCEKFRYTVFKRLNEEYIKERSIQ